MRRGTDFPVAGVLIKVTADAPDPLETVSDGAGRFVLRDVPAGRVAIELSADGYMFFQQLPAEAVAAGNNLTADALILPNPILRFSVSLHACCPLQANR